MAAPVLGFGQYNGTAPGTYTSFSTGGPPPLSFASADQPSNTSNITTTYPINAGSNSYELWWLMYVSSVAPAGLSNFGVYWSSTAPTDGSSVSTYLTFKFATNGTYATPVTTASTVATTNINTVTSAPGTGFTAPANTAAAKSGFITVQLQTTSSAAGGPVTFPGTFMTAQYSWF